MANSTAPAAVGTRKKLSIAVLILTSCVGWILGMNFAYIQPAFDDGDLSGYYARQNFGIGMFAILMVVGIVSISIAGYVRKHFEDARNTKSGRALTSMAIVVGVYLVSFSGGALFKLVPWVINR